MYEEFKEAAYAIDVKLGIYYKSGIYNIILYDFFRTLTFSKLLKGEASKAILGFVKDYPEAQDKTVILQQIITKTSNPDILCLQEMDDIPPDTFKGSYTICKGVKKDTKILTKYGLVDEEERMDLCDNPVKLTKHILDKKTDEHILVISVHAKEIKEEKGEDILELLPKLDKKIKNTCKGWIIMGDFNTKKKNDARADMEIIAACKTNRYPIYPNEEHMVTTSKMRTQFGAQPTKFFNDDGKDLIKDFIILSQTLKWGSDDDPIDNRFCFDETTGNLVTGADYVQASTPVYIEQPPAEDGTIAYHINTPKDDHRQRVEDLVLTKYWPMDHLGVMATIKFATEAEARKRRTEMTNEVAGREFFIAPELPDAHVDAAAARPVGVEEAWMNEITALAAAAKKEENAKNLLTNVTK